VDIDPYGAPTELLDSAVQSVAEGGLLMVTATDMAVLCGNHAETCFTKYGSYSLHKEYHHEQALRIMLACISMHAARHKRVIEPILSMSIDFYIRVFVRVRTSAQDSKDAASRLSYVWQSTGCDSWWLQPVGTSQGGKNAKHSVGKGPAVPPACPISDGKFHMGGPIWNQPLFCGEAVQSILEDIKVRLGLCTGAVQHRGHR
jgi:tRNA (guanine26-N2/guanine27-N2)-dimethyltransferase